MRGYRKPEDIAASAVALVPELREIEKLCCSSAPALEEAQRLLEFMTPYEKDASAAAQLLKKIREEKEKCPFSENARIAGCTLTRAKNATAGQTERPRAGRRRSDGPESRETRSENT